MDIISTPCSQASAKSPEAKGASTKSLLCPTWGAAPASLEVSSFSWEVFTSTSWEVEPPIHLKNMRKYLKPPQITLKCWWLFEVILRWVRWKKGLKSPSNCMSQTIPEGHKLFKTYCSSRCLLATCSQTVFFFRGKGGRIKNINRNCNSKLSTVQQSYCII